MQDIFFKNYTSQKNESLGFVIKYSNLTLKRNSSHITLSLLSKSFLYLERIHELTD